MSLSMINAALKTSKATGTDRLVLMILAHHVNEESDACFPSRETICKEAGIKERNLIYCLKKLEALKEIKIMRGSGRGNLTQYKLNFSQEKVQAIASFTEKKGAIESMQAPASFEGKGCNPASEKVQNSVIKGAKSGSAYKDIELKETEKELSIAATPSATRQTDSHIRKNQQIEPVKEPIEGLASSDPVIRVFDHWKKTLNHPRAVLDLKRKRSIKARLKEGFTPDELKSAIDGCLNSDWHMGRHEKNNIEQGGKVYDDISLICRDASKVEQFISYQTENKKQEADQKPERCPECRGAGKVPVRGLLNRAADGSRMEPCPTCQKKVEVVNGNASITAGSLRLATA